MITFKGLGDRASWGHLGNMMFEIASTIGIAEKNNIPYIFPEWEYSKYFKNKIPTTTELNQLNFYPYKEQGFGYKDIKLPPHMDWDLQGFFQSWRYFEHVKDKIKELFEPHELHRIYLEQKYNSIISHPKTCSIHFRGGDYRNYPQAHPLPSKEYFDTAISMFDEDTLFVVFSNEIETTKQMFGHDRFVYIEGESDITDLILMSMCKHNIIANSSFSWWSAYLNKNPDKKVIAPKIWFGPMYGNRDIDDRLPSDWIRL